MQKSPPPNASLPSFVCLRCCREIMYTSTLRTVMMLCAPWYVREKNIILLDSTGIGCNMGWIVIHNIFLVWCCLAQTLTSTCIAHFALSCTILCTIIHNTCNIQILRPMCVIVKLSSKFLAGFNLKMLYI